MTATLTQIVHHFLYASSATMGLIEVALRTVVTYIAAIAIVRIGKKKFMGQHTGFDTLIAFILGSVLSRAMNGTSPLPQTLAAGVVLVLLHWGLTMAARQSPFLTHLLGGHVCTLIEDGVMQHATMKAHGISENDLLEAARLQGRVGSVDRVKMAHLELSGKISVLPKQSPPRVVDIDVRDGVQIVRIEL